MKVTCPKCSKVVQAPDEWAGRKVKCPGCKDMIKLPESQDGAAIEPPPGVPEQDLPGSTK